MVILDIANRQNKIGWGLIALSAIFLELTALFFQYAMGLEPCIMCVYQRLAVAGVLLSGLFGFFLSRNFWGQIGAHVLMMYATLEGGRIAGEHVIKQSAKSFFSTCDLFPNFPSWFPLHEWIPSIFAATGDCSSIDWSFLGMSMPEWMAYIFWGYAAFQMCMLIWIVGDHADRVRGRKKNSAA